jgi:hypothetical protein
MVVLFMRASLRCCSRCLQWICPAEDHENINSDLERLLEAVPSVPGDVLN